MVEPPRNLDAEIAEIAKLTFEPWKKGECEWEPPKNSEWPLEGWKLFSCVTHAFKLLHMTPDEVMQDWSSMPEATVGPMLKLYDNAESDLKIMHMIVQSARARVMVIAARMPEGGADDDR